MAKIKTIIYLHSSKEQMYEGGKKLGLKGKALENFLYCGYEIGIETEVDTETGNFKYIGIKK